MKIGVIIPTRGDRKHFLKFAYRQLALQTRQPDELIVVDDPPLNAQKDITYRYRLGMERAIKKGCDLMIFWEDDDWYANDYIDWMLKNWAMAGKPIIFGINETYYYHLAHHKHLYMKHPGRASMFCTMVTKEAQRTRWPNDNYPFADMHIWKQLIGKAIPFGDKVRAIGIKHGIGLTGGGGHNKQFRWSNQNALSWFRNIVDDKSFKYYERLKIDFNLF